MKKSILAICCSAAVLSLSASDGAIPRQFRVWGKKAPFRLSKINQVNGKVGMESIRIPKGFKEEFADTNTVVPALTDAQKKAAFLPFAYHPQKYMFYYTQPQAAEIGKAARAIGTPGEYVQMAFALRTLKKVESVTIKPAAFVDKANREAIGVLNIDLRRVMDLPMVGKAEKRYIIEPRYMESFEEYDLLNIKKDYTERFFITVKIPDNAAPGIVKSSFKIACRTGETAEMPLMIRILPFKLDKPDPVKEMNFQILANLNDPRHSSWGRDTHPEQGLRTMYDLSEHGMNSVGYVNVNPHVTKKADGTYEFDFNKPFGASVYSLNVYMNNLKRAGLTGPIGYYSCSAWHRFGLSAVEKAFTPEWEKLVAETVKAIDEQGKKNNWPEFIYFTGDEPGSSLVKQQNIRKLGNAIRKGKKDIRLSNFFNGEWNGTADWKLCRDVADINCANYFNDRIVAESKKVGYPEIWLYNGIERTASNDARSHRAFYGFVPHRYNATGVTQYHYRVSGGISNPRLDFAIYDHINGSKPDYVMTYPAPGGPLPTQQWEAVRQGIYDYRYVYTLKNRIKACKNAALKAEAEKVLTNVINTIPGDFMTEKRSHYLQKLSPETQDTMRWKIAQTIMKLDNESK